MSWTVLLEDESGNKLKGISSEFERDHIYNGIKFKLLHYLDPYGNTIFNAKQMDDLIDDLHKLMKIDHNELIYEIILLTEQCKNEPHTYLVFYGD